MPGVDAEFNVTEKMLGIQPMKILLLERILFKK
jgi:hypothetical protein